jgi:hypothetical protein
MINPHMAPSRSAAGILMSLLSHQRISHLVCWTRKGVEKYPSPTQSPVIATNIAIPSQMPLSMKVIRKKPDSTINRALVKPITPKQADTTIRIVRSVLLVSSIQSPPSPMKDQSGYARFAAV